MTIFDKTAVEAAAKEYYQHHRSVNEKPWEELLEGLREAYIENVTEFISAAEASMRSRGLVMDEQKAMLRIGDNMPFEGPVTIIRKETP